MHDNWQRGQVLPRVRPWKQYEPYRASVIKLGRLWQSRQGEVCLRGAELREANETGRCESRVSHSTHHRSRSNRSWRVSNGSWNAYVRIALLWVYWRLEGLCVSEAWRRKMSSGGD
eukprot:5240192-Karenia_brevis.AAC.1